MLLKRTLKFTIAVVLTGVIAGCVGVLLSFLLHFVQHLAFNYSVDHIISHQSFLDGVRASSAIRRLSVLSFCGVVAGVGWWLIYRYGAKLISIKAALKLDKPRMPMVTTFLNDCLQIVTVGLGSPLGREVAPREMSATFAGYLADKLGLSGSDARLLFACAAGAGLSAVYNVPFAGALFTLEVLLVSFRLTHMLTALVVCMIATAISWVGLGNHHQYSIAPITLAPSLIVWAGLIGPLMGLAAYGFVITTNKAKALAPKDGSLIPLNLINFFFIGCLAMVYPELLGNGKGPLQLSFNGTLMLQAVAVILVLRFIVTLSSLRVGVQGGLLTPGLMHGGLLGVLLGGLWNLFFPEVPITAFALVGATAFLAASMRMPLTAIILVAELTNTNYVSVIPMALAVIGAVISFHCVDHYLKRVD